MMNASRNNPAATRQLMLGVTLVELMVALLIGAILLAGAITVYVNSRNAYQTNEILARMQENARFALDILEPDIRQAGFWGLNNGMITVDGAAGAGEPLALAVAGDCVNNFSVDLNQAIGGNNNAYPWAGCAPFGAGAQNSTDVLVVRRGSIDSTALQAGRLQVQSDHQRIQLFWDGLLPGGFAAARSQTHDVVVHAYYVSQDSTIGAGIPSLRRKTLVAGPLLQDEEVIPGVEDFQVQYGVDTSGDGAANRYVNPNNLPAGALIVAVRVWLLMRSDQVQIGHLDNANYVYADRNVAAPNDAFRRMLISKTIELRNTRI
jgi:type IV pilus assembly protein PilW